MQDITQRPLKPKQNWFKYRKMTKDDAGHIAFWGFIASAIKTTMENIPPHSLTNFQAIIFTLMHFILTVLGGIGFIAFIFWIIEKVKKN